MAISALPQAPYRQDRKIFPTPLTTDVLFSEIRDCTRSDFPAYGTPHPNAVKWPHHKLIFIKPVDIERNEIFEFFYAADRENQDLYNFSSGYRNIGGDRDFKIVIREYVTPRAEFDASVPAFKDAMPDVPAGVFDGVSYIFFDKQQKKTEQTELDSHYVLETHTYVETALLDGDISFSAQVPDLMPDKFRALVPRITTENIVEGAAEAPALGVDLLQASEEQINPDVKLVKTISSGRAAAAGKKLTSKRSYVETTDAIIEETYSSEELDVETGLLIAQSSVTDLGNGDYVRETVKVDSWPTLVSSVWNTELSAQVPTYETFINPAGINLGADNTSYKAVNKDRTLQIVTAPPTNALDSYMIEIPSRMDITLPNVLKNISIVWSEEKAIGESIGDWSGSASGENWSLQGAEGSSCSSSASLKPELKIEIEQPWGSNVPVTVHAFFVKMMNNKVTEAQIKSKVKVSQNWPVFKPESKTIICKGVKIGVTAKASGSASAKSSGGVVVMSEKGTTKGKDFDVSLNMNCVNIPPTIHGPINFGQATKPLEVKATAEASWVGTNFPSIDVRSEIMQIINGTVTPSSFSATSPSKIPTSGKYLMRSTVEPYNWGYAKCTAVVLDAANLK